MLNACHCFFTSNLLYFPSKYTYATLLVTQALSLYMTCASSFHSTFRKNRSVRLTKPAQFQLTSSNNNVNKSFFFFFFRASLFSEYIKRLIMCQAANELAQSLSPKNLTLLGRGFLTPYLLRYLLYCLPPIFKFCLTDNSDN